MSSFDALNGDSDPAVLSISEVSRRTEIPVAGLRNWELPGQLEARLSGEPGPSSADLRQASSLLERTLDYVATINRSDPRGADQDGTQPA